MQHYAAPSDKTRADQAKFDLTLGLIVPVATHKVGEYSLRRKCDVETPVRDAVTIGRVHRETGRRDRVRRKPQSTRTLETRKGAVRETTIAETFWSSQCCQRSYVRQAATEYSASDTSTAIAPSGSTRRSCTSVYQIHLVETGSAKHAG